MRENIWYFVDTNIFLRIFIKENSRSFKDCLSFLRLVSQHKIKVYTSTIVLMEINFVLSSFYKFPKEKVIEAIKSIIEMPYLKIIDDADPRYGLDLYQKNKQSFSSNNVKFVDCLLGSSSLIMSGKATIVSYDQDFDRLKIKRREPGDF